MRASPVSPVAAPRHPVLVMNPRSGAGTVARFGLPEAARRLGATVVMLDRGTGDLAGLVGRAVDEGADLLGAAGGDGTLGVVAGVAAERRVPFVVIPAGTRNHFAMDLGLDRSRPDRALTALTDGADVLVDLGTADGHPFVNTASFGAYAEIVQRPDYRDDKLRVTLEVLPEILAGHEHRPFSVAIDTFDVPDPTAVLVSNNPYAAGDIAGLDRRPRLDTGTLGVICVRLEPPGRPPLLVHTLRTHPPVLVTTATTVVVDAPGATIAAAIDGESLTLPTPVRCTLLPGALRVRVPRRSRRRRPWHPPSR